MAHAITWPKRAAAATLTLAFAGSGARASARELLQAGYMYRLSDVNGAIPMSWPGLTYDASARELYVSEHQSGEIWVFRQNGMEVQRFGGEEAFGTLRDVAVLPDGDLLVLAFRDQRPTLFRCDFRGEVRDTVELKDVPEAFAKSFHPTAIRQAGGKIYLADKEEMKILVTDEHGIRETSYEILPLLDLGPKKRADGRMNGFNVDRAGNMLFTIGPLFSAFVLSPSGQLQRFGVRGSSPGKFNVVGGIAADERGYLYLTDILRAVVMVFDPSFEFVGEFGYRGYGEENLITPVDIAVSDGKVFVAQGAQRGVSVFRISIRDAAAGRSG